MSPPRRERRGYAAHAVRVAVVVTLLIGVFYVAVMVIFNLVNANRLVAQVDAHLSDRLSTASYSRSLSPRSVGDDHDLDDVPVVVWRVDDSGHTFSSSTAAPALPAAAWSRSGLPTTARLGSTSFRFEAQRAGDGWLVAGESLADTTHIERVLIAAEAIAGPFVLMAVFLGTLVIGLKASGPVEAARRRQLEFTADASHELRTPLSVIEAEVALSLSARRDAAAYRETLERVGGENKRLRRIVEDLLWLARFDAEPPPPGDEPVDILTLAHGCAERFGAVAQSRGIDVSVRSEGEARAWISAPVEWIDRLIGVLVDNACRHAGAGRAVAIVVGAHGNRVSLAVDDSGPGIPAELRPQLFDRFYRATEEGTGAGLGLAIADSVVRSTGGRWHVGDAALGGAHMEVSWHRPGPRYPSPRRSLTSDGNGETGRSSSSGASTQVGSSELQRAATSAPPRSLRSGPGNRTL